MSRKRVVVTGISAITPLGLDVKSTWEGILAGKSGIKKITSFDTTGFDTDIAGEIPDFTPDTYLLLKLSIQNFWTPVLPVFHLSISPCLFPIWLRGKLPL